MQTALPANAASDDFTLLHSTIQVQETAAVPAGMLLGDGYTMTMAGNEKQGIQVLFRNTGAAPIDGLSLGSSQSTV